MKNRLTLFAALAPALLALSATARAQEGDVKELAAKAQDVLTKHCAACHHNKERPKGGLNLMDHEKFITKGKIVVAKKPDESILIELISLPDDDPGRMPPSGKPALSPAEKQVLRDWVVAGAPAFPLRGIDTAATKKIEPEPRTKTIEPAKPIQKVVRDEKQPAAPQSIAARVKEIFRTHCFTCHSGPSPRGTLHIFDVAKMREKKLVDKDDAENSEMLVRLRGSDPNVGVMPPTGPRVSAQEIEDVLIWILKGAPDFDDDLKVAQELLGRDYIYEQILKDVRLLGLQATKHRYFSLNHLLTAGITKEDLKAHEHALALAINHLSWEPTLQKPIAIDPANSIFRVNVEALGWLKTPYQDVAANQVAATTLFDLILLEYPYGAVADNADPTYPELAKQFLQDAKQVRPIAYLRSDWFVSIALQSPLYEDMLQLPRNIADLERMLNVNSKDNIDRFSARRAGMTVSGVSRNNRIVERHQMGAGYYWKSYDYATSAGSSSILANPATRTADGGEMIWSLPNGLQAYYVCDAKGNRISEAPTTIVVDQHASDKIVRNGLSCIRCHTSGIQDFEDVVKPAIDEFRGVLPGVNRLEVSNLYETKKLMDGLIAQDRASFLAAVNRLIGEPVNVTDVMERVSHRFLDKAINGHTAIAELGKNNPDFWKAVFVIAAKDLLGMSNLAKKDGGNVRRDAWEASHDRVIEALAMGTPVLPLNGLTHRNFEPREKHAVEINIRREALDKAEIIISNKGSVDLFIDPVVIQPDGRIVRLSADIVELKAKGKAFRVPEKETEFITVEPDEAPDNIVVFSGTKRFEPGRVLRFTNPFRVGTGMDDRLVHSAYDVRLVQNAAGLQIDVQNAQSDIQKKTVQFVTR